MCTRYRRLQRTGKPQNVIVVAIDREMAAFVWAIAESDQPSPMTAGFGLNQIVRRAALAGGVRLQPILATNSLASLRHFVLSGLGVSFMSGLAAGPGLLGRCTASRILNAADVRLLVRAGRDLSPALVELLQVLRCSRHDHQNWPRPGFMCTPPDGQFA